MILDLIAGTGTMCVFASPYNHSAIVDLRRAFWASWRYHGKI